MKAAPLSNAPLINTPSRKKRKKGEADTSKVGVLSLVMLSVLLWPLSLPAWRSGAAGAEGASVSRVTVRPAEGVDALPAASTAATV